MGISRLLSPYHIAEVEERATWPIQCHRNKRLGEVKISVGFGEAGAGNKKSQGQLLGKQSLERVLHGLRRMHPREEECMRDHELLCARPGEQRLSEAAAHEEFCGRQDKARRQFLHSAFALCHWAPALPQHSPLLATSHFQGVGCVPSCWSGCRDTFGSRMAPSHWVTKGKEKRQAIPAGLLCQ